MTPEQNTMIKPKDGLEFIAEPTSANGKLQSRITVEENGKVIYIENVTLDSLISRTRFINQVVRRLQSEVPVQDLEQKLLELTVEQQDQVKNPLALPPMPDLLESMPDEIKAQASEMLKSPDLFEIITSDIEIMGIAGERDLATLLYIIMSSRQLDKPLSCVVQGASSSGKSYVLNGVSKLMPPEALVSAHDFTDQALYYMPEGGLKHKTVIAGEREQEFGSKDGRAESNSKAFREMVGDGVLRKCVTCKGEDGKMTTILIEQPGPIAYLESTTATTLHDEDATRLLFLCSDESPRQTEIIFQVMILNAKGEGPDEIEQENTKLKHWAAQRMLRPFRITIPFCDSLTLPLDKLVVRRTYGHLLSAIKAVALLRQFQKHHYQTEDGGEYIEADEHDYAAVHKLLSPVLSRSLSDLPEKSIALLQIIEEQTKIDGEFESFTSFTILDATGWSGCSDTQTRKRLKPLTENDIISIDEIKRTHLYKLVNPQHAEKLATKIGLPDPEDIFERVALMKEEL